MSTSSDTLPSSNGKGAVFNANPYRAMLRGQWRWFFLDEQNKPHGPYDYQMDALRGLLNHLDPPLARLWRKLKEFTSS